MSSSICFRLELGCEIFTFLDQAVKEFEPGLDCILTDSNKTAELGATFKEHDATNFFSLFKVPMLSKYLPENSKLQLATSTKFDNLWYQTRV